MDLLTTKVKSKIKEHSLSEFPDECCGLIVLDQDNSIDSMKCKNIANNKSSFFEIDPLDYLKVSEKGDIKAYYHSHTSDNHSFSGADKAISQSSNLPLIMYSVKINKFSEYHG
jgi:proteasome lid subunit RPN8/RPN11